GWLGVIAGDEALALRRAGLSAPIFIMGAVEEGEVDGLLAAGGLRFAVFDMAQAEMLSAHARGRQVPIHVEVDTGLGRLSVTETYASAFVGDIAHLPGLYLEGLYTHLADAEGMDQSYTMAQFASFKRIQDSLRQEGVRFDMAHVAGSAAAILLSDLRCDLVRTGISIYGYWPAEETRLLMMSHEQDLLKLANDSQAQAKGVRGLYSLLRPVLSWKARLLQAKTVPAHSSVGYGCSYQTLRDTRVGVVSVGYADGFDRHLSNNGRVLVRGQQAPILGRICMNLCMIDVTDVAEASPGDEVVLIGRQGDQELTAEEMARRVGSIHYEIVTRINWSVPRVYLNEEQPAPHVKASAAAEC
ncbi:MAG TPA: alanine racemase, partial [Candidatus Xenobia bacterium]